MKKIISDLESGRFIDWKTYSFYTLANIAKRYLLHIEGGILGPEAESHMIRLLDSPDDQIRMEAMHSVIVSQPKAVQQLLALLFGIWFRMIYHTEVNAMSVEAVAKSVAGSVFPSSTTSPEKVERASKVMEYLITGFASADLFSRELIEYFTNETQTSISRVEKFKYEFRFPAEVPREISTRLFTKLLQEESEKHGFDLIYDAVSKEVFENANWDNACPVEYSFGGQLNDTDQMYNTPVYLSNRPLHSRPSQYVPSPRQCQDQTDCTSANDNAFIRTQIRNTPTLSKQISCENATRSPTIWDSPGRAPGNEPVQQLSEKHTCVTAAAFPNQPLVQLDSQKQNDFSCFQNDNNARDMPWCTLPEDPRPKVLAHSVSQQAACFSSVKRRQLERLQKRSDWFLSPPAGLRSTGLLMHLNPTSSRTTTTPLRDQNVSRQPCAFVPLFGERGQMVPINEDTGVTDNDATWTTINGSVTGPTATSSPKRCRNSLISGKRNNDEKENFPEIEVRYFVVERYYGPRPQSSSLTYADKQVPPAISS